MKNKLLLSVLILFVTLPLFAFKSIDSRQPIKVPQAALVVKSVPPSVSLEANKETADANTDLPVIKHDVSDTQKTESPVDNTELSGEAENKDMADSTSGHNDAVEYYNMGVSHNIADRHREAVAAFKQAINIKPDYVEAHYGLGLSYLILDDKVSALGQYKILKTLDPKEADSLHLKALAITSSNIENKYVVQVGAYKNIENANKMLGKLQSDYLLANIKQINNLNKVRIHGIKTINEANRTISDILKRFKLRPYLMNNQ
jgi:tetratricopeptide (TPR) repeat protein